MSTLAALTRSGPSTWADAGSFLTVAGRLLAGDALYRHVYDNKDPLFYYGQSLALWASGWRGPFLMDILWLVIASVSTHLFLRAVTDDLVVAVFGQVLYPLLLTGLNYYAGYSELPGLSLIPLFAYFLHARRLSFAGGVAAVVALLKLNLLPVIAAIAVAGVVLAPGHRVRARHSLVLVGSTVAGISVIFLVLGVRGELLAYLASIRQNATYASAALTAQHLPAGLHGHLLVVYRFMPWAAWASIVAILAFLTMVILGGSDSRRRLRRFPLTLLTVAATLGTAVALGATAIWDHHLALIAFPMLCGSSLALECARSGLRGSRPRRLTPLRGAVVVGSALLLVASLEMKPPTRSNLVSWDTAPATPVSDSLQAAAGRSGFQRLPVSYFHLGANDDTGQGAFLDKSFRLSCPYFQQYTFSPPTTLQETMSCIQRTRPHLVAVTPTFASAPAYIGSGTPPLAWATFVRDGEEYLRTHCNAVVEETFARVYRCP